MWLSMTKHPLLASFNWGGGLEIQTYGRQNLIKYKIIERASVSHHKSLLMDMTYTEQCIIAL